MKYVGFLSLTLLLMATTACQNSSLQGSLSDTKEALYDQQLGGSWQLVAVKSETGKVDQANSEGFITLSDDKAPGDEALYTKTILVLDNGKLTQSQIHQASGKVVDTHDLYKRDGATVLIRHLNSEGKAEIKSVEITRLESDMLEIKSSNGQVSRFKKIAQQDVVEAKKLVKAAR